MNSALSPSRTRKGYLFVVAAAIFWGISGSAAKFLFNSDVSAFRLVQLRLTIAAAGLFLWLLVRKRDLIRIDPRDTFYFILFGVAGMASVQFTYLYAISKIHVAAAILLQYTAPAFIAVYAVVFFKDRLSPVTLLALGGALIGCYFVVGGYNLEIMKMNLAGVISGLLSGVGFAWYSIHGEYGMRKYNPWTVLFYALLIAAAVWNIINFAHPPLDRPIGTYRAAHWGWVVYIGIMGTLLPFGLYLEGVNLIRSTRASITATLEPITAGVLSFFFLGERMEPLQLFGGALVIISVVLLQLRQELDDKAPALMRARKES
jgi:drug/metabolite transporter, DME family